MTDSHVAYDRDRLGVPGEPGVPTGDQHPTNEGRETRNIRSDVHIPGPYPGEGQRAESSAQPEPTKESRAAASLGDVVQEGGAGMMDYPANPGFRTRGSAATPEDEVKKLKEETFAGDVPDESDVGSGRRKGQGLPPGSVDRIHDTPQTPAS